VIEPFSPKHNVIVGRNGSGKSNFFAAIRFVLGDAYNQMGREARQALLHEGTGPAVMSAFVEIIFDNSDDRFPTGKPELVLRRTIGTKKDEYTLDRKNATKTDVMNLLESAGFSRSNPYYIVPQGRVTALTNMKDPERLTLLKEVAGTQVYEARRQESLKIMAETNNKRASIDNLLDFLRERLTDLEEEKEELRDYQEKDKERRCLQYTIDHREQVAISTELDALDGHRQTGVEDTDDSRNQFLQGEKELASIEAEINQLKQQAAFLNVDKQSLDSDKRETAKEKARIELRVNELTQSQSAAKRNREEAQGELEAAQEAVDEREHNLEALAPDFKARVDEETQIKDSLDEAEAASQRLYAKSGRNAKFRSKNERNEWLRKQIDDTYPKLSQIKAVRMQTEEDSTSLSEQIAARESELSAMRDQLNSRNSGNDDSSAQFQKARTSRDKLNDERKELWREEAKSMSMLENARSELKKAEQTVQHTMDREMARGLASVRRIVKQHKIEGVYGTLAELIEVNDKYRTAVEVTAGNSLFHFVVDTEQTSSKIVDILNEERGGRVTFMPLNRLKPKVTDLKKDDVLPMLEKIRYEAVHERAVQQVFGKTVVCRNIQVASQYARSHGVNGVTLDGDRSDKRGALTGGYLDTRSSRLEAVRHQSKWQKEEEAHRKRHKEVEDRLRVIAQEITQAEGVLRGLEQAKKRHEGSFETLRQDLKDKEVDLQNMRDSVDVKNRAMAKINSNLKSLNDQLEATQEEMKSDFKKALTSEEEAQLEALGSTIQELRQQLIPVSAARSEVEARKSVLEIALRENFRPRLEQIEAKLRAQDDGSPAAASEAERALAQATAALQTLGERQAAASASLEQLGRQMAELEQQRGETRAGQEELARGIERQARRMEKAMQKRALLAAQAAAVAGRIRDLGVLPQQAFGRFARTGSEQLVRRLHAVNDALRKYSRVNKKAFQQHEQFAAQREALTRRRAELDASQASIEELVAVLDLRKDEAIERTFRQVSREFARVFEALVPAGRGRLIIQRKADQSGDQMGEEAEESGREGRDGVENYTGVGIAVSFNSKHDDQQRIQQLSGGQKSEPSRALTRLICLFGYVERRLTSLTTHRSLRARAGLRHPALRPGAVLPVRRDRREPGRAVPDRGRADAAGDRRPQRGGRAVHLHHLPAGDAAGGGQVLRRALRRQEQLRRHRQQGGRDGVCAGRAEAVKRDEVVEGGKRDGRRARESSVEPGLLIA